MWSAFSALNFLSHIRAIRNEQVLLNLMAHSRAEWIRRSFQKQKFIYERECCAILIREALEGWTKHSRLSSSSSRTNNYSKQTSQAIIQPSYQLNESHNASCSCALEIFLHFVYRSSPTRRTYSCSWMNESGCFVVSIELICWKYCAPMPPTETRKTFHAAGKKEGREAIFIINFDESS